MTKLAKYAEVVKLSSLIGHYDLFLFDLWGVLLKGDTAYPNATDIVNDIIAKKKLMFISNSSRTSLFICDKLKNLGFNAEPEMVITSGELTKNILLHTKQHLNIANPIIYNLGTNQSHELWANATNIETSNNINQANLLIIAISSPMQSDSKEIDDILHKAAELKIPAICANNDKIAFHNDNLIYCAGHFADKFEKLGGKVLYIGKPFEPIFHEALNYHLDIDKKQILMIGDTLDTDISGANGIGIDSALVTTGNIALQLHDKINSQDIVSQIEEICQKANIYPNYIVSL